MPLWFLFLALTAAKTLQPEISDLLLPNTEHEKDEEALERIEDEEDDVEEEASISDCQEPRDPRNTQENGDSDCILDLAP